MPGTDTYARARWYDARNAVFLTEDPVGDVDSPNLYAFVGWQPHMAVDPLGETSLREARRDLAEYAFEDGHWWALPLAFAADLTYAVANAVTFGTIDRIDDAQEAFDAGEIDQAGYWTQVGLDVGEAAISYAVGGAAGNVVVKAVGGALKKVAGTAVGKALTRKASMAARRIARKVSGKGRYRPGDVLPDGRIAGQGPGAAHVSDPGFGGGGVAGKGDQGKLARARQWLSDVKGPGVYEFMGQSGQTYVGQSQVLWRRLFWKQKIRGKTVWGHLWTGKLTPKNLRTVRFRMVVGSARKRRVAEQRRMNYHGGLENLENKYNSLGRKRMKWLEWKRYRTPGFVEKW